MIGGWGVAGVFFTRINEHLIISTMSFGSMYNTGKKKKNSDLQIFKTQMCPSLQIIIWVLMFSSLYLNESLLISLTCTV